MDDAAESGLNEQKTGNLRLKFKGLFGPDQ